MSVAAVPYSISIPYGIMDIEGKRDIKGLIENLHITITQMREYI